MGRRVTKSVPLAGLAWLRGVAVQSKRRSSPTFADNTFAPDAAPSGPTRILRLKEVIRLVGLSRSQIYQMAADGTFPKPIKIGVHASGWNSEEVAAWIAQRFGGDVNRTGPAPSTLRPDASEPRSRECEDDELQRLRTLESRVRQIAQLLAEIAALVEPTRRNKSEWPKKRR
jgi:prophage regulatory protein